MKVTNSTKISLTKAAKLLGREQKTVKKMVEDGILSARKTKEGSLRFSTEEIAAALPSISEHISMLSGGYVRPKRIIGIKRRNFHIKGKNMEIYTRNAHRALSFGQGFKPEVRLVLSALIDLMAMHQDKGGIPATPDSYVAGMLGLGQRKWTQTVLPVLIDAKRLKRVKIQGIYVYRFDDRYMPGGQSAIFELNGNIWDLIPKKRMDDVQFREQFLQDAPRVTVQEAARAEAKLNSADAYPGPKRDLPTASTLHRDVTASATAIEKVRQEMIDDGLIDLAPPPQEPENNAGKPISEAKTTPVVPTDAKDRIDLVAPPQESATNPGLYEITPAPSAYTILHRAGIDVDDHHAGQLFWLRTEHQEIVDRWIKTKPVGAIVEAIDRARIAGKLPSRPNSLLAFEDIVMGEV